MTSSMPAFVRGAKKLMLLKLDGEPGYGIHEEKHYDANGHPVFLVRRVERLSPADRAGIARGDQLLNVKVLGVDTLAYVWSDAALERLERFHEICVVEICVKKRDGARISDLQQRHRDHFSQWLTKAKTLSVSTKRFRGAFIASQLRRVVALLYDYEHGYFADRWKELREPDRAGIALPLARAFVSETKLPGIVEDRPTRTVASLPTTPIPTPPPSPARTDADATVSMAGSTSDLGHTETEDESPRPASPLATADAEPSTATTMTSRDRPKLQTMRTASERRRQRARRGSGLFDGRDDDHAADVVFIKVERSSATETPPTLTE